MILLLDAGNTRVKWGVRQAGVWLARGVCSTREVACLPADLAIYPLRRALLCCVANEATRAALGKLLLDRVEHLAWLTSAADAHGVRNAYQPPESLGADRYAALVAAARRGLGDCVVVSVGTALTVDALTADGRFLGGAIAPGPDLMRAALLDGTAGVRDYAPPMQARRLRYKGLLWGTAGVRDCAGSVDSSVDSAVDSAVANSVAGFPVATGAAVASGIALAQAGVVAGMRERLARSTGKPVTVLLSGGARALLTSLLEPPVVEVDDLVLEGLAWIAKDKEWDD
ncbi:MAG: type III pantothenate kinase [Pseudomonadota bacterium]|nr:type III pantothenate kinase [Pseudomonadota bacterium]